MNETALRAVALDISVCEADLEEALARVVHLRVRLRTLRQKEKIHREADKACRRCSRRKGVQKQIRSRAGLCTDCRVATARELRAGGMKFVDIARELKTTPSIASRLVCSGRG